MADPTTAAIMRKERITRLLHELEYELVRGITDNEIEEEMHWRQIFPISRSIPNGVVTIEFTMRPRPHWDTIMWRESAKPRLRLVGESDD